MKGSDFTMSFLVDQKPEDVFEAINNVGAWWTLDIKGNSHKVNDEFEARFGDVHYSRQKVTQLVPGRKIVWLITDSALTFLTNQKEWTGTEVQFDIVPHDNKTEVRLTHKGLVPQVECYDACSSGWTQYLKFSLPSLISDGIGQPGFPPTKPIKKVSTH